MTSDRLAVPGVRPGAGNVVQRRAEARQNAIAADKGFKVVGVNLDANMADADKFLEKVPAEFLLAFDPQGVSPRLYGVKGMPTSYLIDRTGKVIYRHMGFNEDGKAELEKAIRNALEQK